MRRQELSGSVQRRGRFVKDRVIGLEYVRHLGGDVEGDLDVGGGSLPGEADGVVEENLVADILDVLHGSSLAAHEQSSLPSAEELSPGELRVLRYLPTNLSRPEIAGELSVSLNTVSTHLRSIYAKLQVRDRSSAVQRARELRLLAAGRTR